jgi:hypothetical protein
MGLAAALWLPRLRGPIDLRYDAAVYYILGTSLSEGRGYRILSEPGAIEAIQYPPLLSAAAALHQRALGTSDPLVVGPALRLTLCVMYIGYAAAVFALALRFLSPGYAFLASLLAVVHVQTVFLSDNFAADVPYAFMSILALLAAGAGAEPRPANGESRRRSVLAALLMLATYGLRAAGIALLGAWVGDSLLRRRFREGLARAVVALLAVGAWQTYTSHVKTSPAYAEPAYAYQRASYQFYNVDYADNMKYRDPFRPELGPVTTTDVLERVAANLRTMPFSLGEAVSVHRGWWRGQIEKINLKAPWLPAPMWLADVALLAMCLPVLVGLALLALRGHWLIVLYTAATVLLVSITPWPGQFSRYLVPMTPVVTLAFVVTLAETSRRAGRGGRVWWGASRLLSAAVGLIVLQQVYAIAKSFRRHHERVVYVDAAGRREEYRLFFYDRTWQLHDEGLNWLATRLRPGEIVATSTPHWLYLRTGIPAVMPPYEADPAEAERLLESVPVTYLIVDHLGFVDIGRRYTLPLIERNPGRWSLVYSSADDGPRIYRRSAASTPTVSASAPGGRISEK